MLTPVEFGMMALILTTYEMVRMLIHNGVGARIVQAADCELDAVCCGVWRINWVVGGLMCLIQIAIAWPVQSYFAADVAPMLFVLGIVHLIYPIGMIHASLALRRDQLGLTAGMLAFQISMDNLCTAAMALLGYGLWSAIVPKIGIAIVWVAIHLRVVPSWKGVAVPRDTMRGIITYSRTVFFAESLNTLRANADKLIVGKVLGIEAFGISSFAANAGAGIATGLSTALGQAALPFLSAPSTAENAIRGRFFQSIKAMCAIIVPIVMLQAFFAPIYVPAIFGERWAPAIPTLMLLCLGTLARPIAVATSQLLRATNHVDLELRISQWNAVLFFAATFAGLPFGVEGVAMALLVAGLAPALIFARQALKRACEISSV